MTDLVGFGEATLRLRGEQGRRLADTDAFTVGISGPERNAVVTASGLGADAVWLSRLPDSPLGQRVVADLRRHGVRTGVSWADPSDRLATTFVANGPAPRGVTTIEDRDGAAFEDLHAANLPIRAVQETDRFHVTGATPARSERVAAATETLLDAAAQQDTTNSFDLRYEKTGWDQETARAAAASLFPHVDVLFVSLEAAQQVLGEEGAPVEIAHALRTDNGFETVVLLQGDGGALAVHGTEVHERDAVAAETVDEAGARDAFVGAFHARRTDGGNVGDALAWGAAAAALARTLSGDTVDVSRQAVEEIVTAEK